MKKGIFLILSFISCAINAQDKSAKKQAKAWVADAQFAFDEEDYGLAWKMYRQIHAIDSLNETAGVNGAICATKLNYSNDSLVLFEKNLSVSKLHDAKYYLAKIRHQLHEPDRALQLLAEYKTKEQKKRLVSDEDVTYLIARVNNAKKYKATPHRSVIKNMGASINSPYPDYVPVITPDESALFFTSKRQNSLHPYKNADNSYFEDVYVSYNENGTWKKAENIGFPINTRTNDGCVAISPDGQRMILYRTAEDKVNGDLYITQMGKNNRWQEPKKMGSTINSEYLESSACFSTDTSEIYFSSDRPGGFGGKDIYRVKKLPNGNWSVPFNLGPQINSKYDEDAPFLHPDGFSLYFSSKGHDSMGEYDIFKSIVKDGKVDSVVNLGYPINDVGNDIFFVLSVDGQRGYYSSIKKETFGGLDIYQIDTRFGDNDLVVKHGKVSAEGSAERVKITLIDKETNEVNGNYFSNPDNGKFIMVANPLKFYKAVFEADGYESQELDIRPVEAGKEENNLSIRLKKSNAQ